MTGTSTADRPSTGRFRIPRSRGALMGVVLVLLGSWGVLIPFFGQQFGLSYAGAGQWEWTAARGWLQVVPGFVTIVGGIVLIESRNRLAAVLGAWLSAFGGAWFIVGRAVAEPLGVSYAAVPSTTGPAEAMWIEIANFTGIGAAIMLVAALILGRLSVRSPRDIRYADSTFAHDPVSDEDPGQQAGAASPQTRHRHWTDLFGRRDTTPAH